MTTDDAIKELLRDPAMTEQMRDGYFTRGAREEAEAFAASAEFAATLQLLGGRVRGGVVADVGAGRGLASFAFLRAGAATVYAVEPSPSELLGRGAIRSLGAGAALRILDCPGEAIALPAASVDVVYCRQTLHHAADLGGFVAECARILKPGGIFLAAREHVVDDAAQLAAFLAQHPVHRLAGGEHAYPVETYRAAIRRAGLRVRRVLRTYDSVICAYPAARSERELARLHHGWMRRRFGAIGAALAWMPGLATLATSRLNRQPTPGRVHSFLAEKPT